MRDEFCLHPLTDDERATSTSMLSHEQSRLMLMPTHHIDELGDMGGFRFDCPPFAPGGVLPISRSMFHGHTLVECHANEEAILRLMSASQENKEKMRAFLEDVDVNCQPATLECVPENASATTGSRAVVAQGLRTVDSKHWSPEVPERIGIYHAYVRGFNRDQRSHRLFLSCSGGMNKASDAFCNLIIDVGKHWTAHEICESEEAWWLRKGCQRARCRILKQLADWFGVSIHSVQDIQSHHFAEQAVHTSDTLEHDLGKMGDRVAVYNRCTDTTRNMNGILCSMHPSEGVWIFRGSSRGNCFGSMFGSYSLSGVFPTSAPRVRRLQSIQVQDGAPVVRLRSKSTRNPYMCFDEAYFKTLEAMQWNRDSGHIELIPIVVGLP
jgi:hypothetical protein